MNKKLLFAVVAMAMLVSVSGVFAQIPPTWYPQSMFVAPGNGISLEEDNDAEFLIGITNNDPVPITILGVNPNQGWCVVSPYAGFPLVVPSGAYAVIASVNLNPAGLPTAPGYQCLLTMDTIEFGSPSPGFDDIIEINVLDPSAGVTPTMVVVPDPLNFGPVPDTVPTTLPFTVSNGGAGDLVYSLDAFYVSGADAANFDLTRDIAALENQVVKSGAPAVGQTMNWDGGDGGGSRIYNAQWDMQHISVLGGSNDPAGPQVAITLDAQGAAGDPETGPQGVVYTEIEGEYAINMGAANSISWTLDRPAAGGTELSPVDFVTVENGGTLPLYISGVLTGQGADTTGAIVPGFLGDTRIELNGAGAGGQIDFRITDVEVNGVGTSLVGPFNGNPTAAWTQSFTEPWPVDLVSGLETGSSIDVHQQLEIPDDIYIQSAAGKETYIGSIDQSKEPEMLELEVYDLDTAVVDISAQVADDCEHIKFTFSPEGVDSFYTQTVSGNPNCILEVDTGPGSSIDYSNVYQIGIWTVDGINTGGSGDFTIYTDNLMGTLLEGPTAFTVAAGAGDSHTVTLSSTSDVWLGSNSVTPVFVVIDVADANVDAIQIDRWISGTPWPGP